MEKHLKIFIVALIACLLLVPFILAPSSIKHSFTKQIIISKGTAIDNQANLVKVYIDHRIPQDSIVDILVLLKDFSYMQRVENLLREHRIKILHEYRSAPLLLVKGLSNRIISLLSKLDFVKGIYANVRFHPKFSIPHKYYIVAQSQAKPTTSYTSELVGAKALWNLDITGKGIKVAVVDTGINAKHPDLTWPNGTSKVIAAKSFVSPEYGLPWNETPDDVIGHGTAVAGIIAGTGERNPDIGIGMAPEALLINAKVIGGTEQQSYGTLASVLAGIEWAVIDAGADVINLSLGAGEFWGDPTFAVIERLVKNYGVVIVAAAGNEGDGEGLSSMSIGTPGAVHHIICVGAVNYDGASLEAYSSIGPTIYGYVKPDVVAPSNIYVITPDGYSEEQWWGTSFSSPHVAGVSALLVQYLKSKNVDKRKIPGFVKAALMLTARKDIRNYDALAIGAGLINVSAAYYLLKDTLESGSGKIATIHPTRIPVGYTTTERFFPYYNTIFRGQTICWNLTIVSSYDDQITIDVSSLSSIFDFHSPLSINITAGTNLWEFNATVRTDAPLGDFIGFILIYDSSGKLIGNLTVEGNVAEPKGFILFDLAHTDWSNDFPWGQYRKFAEFLTEMGYAIEIIYPHQRYTANLLSKYDIVYAPDTSSYYWIYNESGFYIANTTWAFSDEEIALLKQYVQSGGILIASCMEPLANNFTAFNKLAHVFHMHFVGKRITDLTAPASANQSIWFFRNISTIPFYGTYIEPLSPSVMMGATYGNYMVIGLFSYISKDHPMGLAFLTSTNFLFDNWAFTGKYGVPVDKIKMLFTNIFEFKCNLSQLLHVNVSNNETININKFAIFKLDLPQKWSLVDTWFIDSYGYGYIPCDMIYTINDTWYLKWIPRTSGTVMLSFVIEDPEGHIIIANVEFIANVIEYYPDADIPVIHSWSISPSEIEMHDTVTVIVNASDSTTYISGVIVGYEYLNMDLKVNISAKINKTSGIWTASFVLDYYGDVKITIYVYDAAGNCVTDSQAVHVRDTVRPRIVMVTWTNITNVENITFYAKITDNIGVSKVYFDWTYDNETWNTSEMIKLNETTWVFTLEDIRDAVLTIRIRAVDIDGNVASKNIVVGHVIPYRPQAPTQIPWEIIAIVAVVVIVGIIAGVLIKKKR